MPTAVRRRRLQEQWGLTDLDLRDVVNAGALELVEATVAAGTTGSAQWRPKLADGVWTVEATHLGNDDFEGSTGGPITVHVGP